MRSFLVLVSVLAFFACSARATTFGGHIVVLTNNGSTYTIKVQLKVDAPARLGGATLILTYNTADLTFAATPVAETDYHYYAFSGGSYTSDVRHPASNQVSINILYGGSTGTGTLVGTSFMDVVSITFTTNNVAGSSQLAWFLTEASGDDHVAWIAGTFDPENTTPLPIQLTAFRATTLTGSSVRLAWQTANEIDNYGFEVQRSADKLTGFQTIPGSFQPGHGTSLEPHQYSWTDISASSAEPWYRLKQTDLDQTVHYSEAQQVGGLTSVREAAPLEFQLLQNYPNPFNPATQITFSVKQTGPATLKLYSMLGQEVATLFEGQAEAGQYYRLTLDGHRLASGVYLYRLVSGDKKDIKRLVLMK